MTAKMTKEAIVLAHGFGGHRWLMLPLARRLRRQGYCVINWGYRSILHDIERHAHEFLVELQRLENSHEISRFHIVAHSMGSLVTRQALLESCMRKLQRIVLICPPNRGSHVATLYARPFGWLSKSLLQLSDMPDSFTDRLPLSLAEQYEVGIIAASADFVVRLESTHLPGVKQHIVVPGLHSSTLFSLRTAQLTTNFIRTGQFAD